MAEPSKHIQIERRGLMLVISSPSGAGTSTIARNLLEAAGITPDFGLLPGLTRHSEIVVELVD